MANWLEEDVEKAAKVFAAALLPLLTPVLQAEVAKLEAALIAEIQKLLG